ncbi:hypothetical protein LZX53_001870 [Salmonella enterica]|nr:MULTISPECIES: hypothetical protein [Enterobacteriaceae]EBG8180873.1 hypothetical protein [Salmonella enterica subsp. enterica serovar Litchfield]EBV0440450.1 hypothetical protein [Salmonella enterica subsp. enterica serovar Brandenburg]EBW1554603.1 hypothetical protein [Salmonella enterica subsp. enterica serovar Hartford]ECS7335775.1 hypothetical protein [Salmonella enterica subsp. enterica serovar Berta]ECU7929336.1 hypothetical protein [Salmonella enterica subsp. enterica serovar Goldcoa
MTKSLKKPRAHYQWMGATVVTTQSLSSGVAVIPAGSRGVVEGAKRGLSVVFDACPCCGVQLRLTRIRPEMLDIVAYPDVEEVPHVGE